MSNGSRNYYLLTGGTGLLGRYLLRGLLLRDAPVALVVRGTKHATAQARVEALLDETEQSVGRLLPRPIVLTGSLSEPDLGMNAEDFAWARRHVSAIVHNAASLSFQDAARHEEPWLSNVTGTAMTLEAARALGVREFHHVSTAYVCGQRQGRILESELNVGQEFGNDYERSKLEAETMVRSAGWLDSATFYRPSIIVGDSRTGFTSTFHGFYTPLHILHTVHNKVLIPDSESRSLLTVLGLSGQESKNLVPVDWVAAAAVHLLLDRRHHRLTYHLATPYPTSVDTLSELFRDALAAFADQRVAFETNGGSGGNFGLAAFQRTFREQMSSYQAYWRDDPQFDLSNTTSHAPHLPCPKLNREALMRLCRFAIENKFWWSRGRGRTPSWSLEQSLQAKPRAARRGSVVGLPLAIRLLALGPGGGDWRVQLENGQIVALEAGSREPCTALVCGAADAFRAVADRDLSLTDAVRSGLISLACDVAPASDLLPAVETMFAQSA